MNPYDLISAQSKMLWVHKIALIKDIGFAVISQHNRRELLDFSAPLEGCMPT